MKNISPQKLEPLLNHLIKYGEINAAEIKDLKSQDQINFLINLNYIFCHEDTYTVTNDFLSLLPVESINELLRKIFFSDPKYQKYLLVIVTEIITRNGLEGAIQQVESMITKNLFHLTGEINKIINEIELLINPNDPNKENILKHVNLIEIINGFKKLHNDNFALNDFETWNKELLGVSGDKQSIFHAVIAKGALNAKDKYVFNIRDNQEEYQTGNNSTNLDFITNLNNDLFSQKERIVYFPEITSDNFENITQTENSEFEKRKYLYSSIPLKTESKNVTKKDIINSLCEHPVSWLLIQLGIIEYLNRSGNSGESQLKIVPVINEDKKIGDLIIYLDSFEIISFTNLLIDILNKLGFRFVLPFNKIPENGINNLLNLFLFADIFKTSENNLSYELSDEFIDLLFKRPFINNLNRNVKRYREFIYRRLEEELNQETESKETMEENI